MARAPKKAFGFDLEPLVQTMGLDWVIEKLGRERVIRHLVAQQVVEQLGPEDIKALGPRLRQHLKRLLEQ